MDLFRKSAHELHELLVNKEISSMELTQSVFNRIDEVEDKVQSYITETRNLALKQAAIVDEKISQKNHHLKNNDFGYIFVLSVET